MRNRVGNALCSLGNAIARRGELPPDLDAAFGEIYGLCKPFTMTSVERMYALFDAVGYVLRAGIAGDFVECGVWRGGGAMMMASTLLRSGAADRTIYLYDTFEGMSEPTEADKDLHGNDARHVWKRLRDAQGRSGWCVGDIEDVERNLGLTGYARERIVLVKGKVEETIPATVPERIAVLHLDTDWFESTYHEFVHLYPLLSSGGVLILDDYGHWKGAREATDRYLAENGINLLLNRIDYTGRIAVKP